MKRILPILLLLLAAAPAPAGLLVGFGVADVTPPAGTPSAGYGDRMGRGMKGTRDPLLATAMAIRDGDRVFAFCNVDHIGMLYDMIRDAIAKVRAEPGLENAEIFVGSSHTHCGAGAFMNFPGLGFVLAGKYDQSVRDATVDGAVRAILEAARGMREAKIGFGYGEADLNSFRSSWPPGDVPTCKDVAVIKVVASDGAPLGALFNFAAHPTVLPSSVLEFSADYVGYARRHIEAALGAGTRAVFFNGAQGDLSPKSPPGEGDAFAACDRMGAELARVVKEVWDATEVSDDPKIEHVRETYSQPTQANSTGTTLPIAIAQTEINAIVFDGAHAFVTIPGELSTIYDRQLKNFGGYLGFAHVSILGLTNDAHGYIITPEAWRHRTYESTVSFGGEMYGETVKNKAQALLDMLTPLPPDQKPPHPASVLSGP